MGDGTDQTDTGGDAAGDGADEQDLVDRDKIDFDPDDGLYSGTAVDGTTDIPGPHEGAPDKNDDTGEDTADEDPADDDTSPADSE